MKNIFSLIASIVIMTHSALYGEEWKPEGYAYVVGYTYDCTKDPLGQSIILKDGSVHDGVIKATTVRLNQRQIFTLMDILSKRPDEEEGELVESDCHDPHHAFVFYDLGWKPVALVNICFLCGNFSTNTQDELKHVDIDLLERFCKKLGMPVLQDDSGYSNLYQVEQGVGQQPESPNQKAEQDSVGNGEQLSD